MLTPTHVDTNSLFITERLNELGIDLQGKSIAGDDRVALKTIVADALRRSDLLIVTGGLGPTDDDLTRDVVADLIGRPLEYHADIFEAIEKRFAARGLRTPRDQSAPGHGPAGRRRPAQQDTGRRRDCGSSTTDKFVVLLPGPPRELKPMFEALIKERLLGHVGASRLFRRLLRITGQSESSVEEKMQPLYAKWLAAPARINTTILASLGQIELHLTSTASSAVEGQRALDAAVEEVKTALGRDLFSTNGETMQQVVGELCRSRGLRIAAAESCTGGLVMARLTEVPGSSDYVDRGVVVYSNQSKIDLLDVPRGAHREAWRRQRARGGGDGGRNGSTVRNRSRRWRDRHCRSIRRHAREAGRHGGDCRRVGPRRKNRHARPDVQLYRWPRDGEVSGIAGGARYGAALADLSETALYCG